MKCDASKGLGKRVSEGLRKTCFQKVEMTRFQRVREGFLLKRRASRDKGEKDWTRRIGNDCHLICIEDPFVVSHDLGRVVDKFSH
ncbi:hypothetical protein GOBAR_AA11194 [Gossypium barbadense]|uniref:Uncharacterized protein n=1 Tax=Gossypium barbadense TaxID=3634 RepID=A0A2P5Y1I6_GOSBA|nr:hypothetical protein GOBAR_AA11194 [Gossypium barbadense]